MRRNSNDMQVNVAGIRRNIKNFAHNYSDAQKKVREATSNDPWGPSSTLMAVIADQTYNVVAFSEIMQMVWKRLNDHGKNWRHVYKALVLLEYMIKTGSEKVAQQCRENIFAIQTLKDFQYLEEGKDQGQNVREKAKQLVNLLKDDERLKNERARALKAKERFAQNSSGFGSDGGLDTPTSPKYPAFKGDWNSREEAADLPREIEIARPQTAGEEELQLQLALAMSREEAEQEEQKRKSDDVRLQLALSQSQNDFKKSHEKLHQSHMVDLLDVQLGDPEPVDPWGMPQPPRPQSLDLSLFGQWYTPMMQSSPWQASSLPSPPNNPIPSADPWLPPSHSAPKQDPWGVPVAAPSVSPVIMGGATASTNKHDPWSPTSPASSTDLDEFDVITNRNRATSPKTNGNLVSSDPFELNLLGDTLSETSTNIATGATKKTPQSFLGENSALVNLDNLVTTNKQTNPSLTANPFSDTAAAPPRPVFNTAPPKPSINEMKQQTFAPFSSTTAGAFGGNPPAPVGFTPAPYGINSQFMPSQVGSVFSTNSNGNAFGGAPQAQDPWTPVPSAVSNGTNSAWIKSNEPANPFLS